MKRIVYQGTRGSFSEQMALKLFPEGELIGCETFKEAYEAVEKEQADLALLPIENSLAGPIYETIDVMSQGSLQILGASRIRIVHSLLGLPGAVILQALSHPKALAQCTKFLEKEHIQPVQHYDTAGAAAEVAKRGDASTAAIAHASAAPLYGLHVLQEGIEDHIENYTRFFLLGNASANGSFHSFCFTLEHKPGSLARMLTNIAGQGINVSTIVSRPLMGRPFEYLFYMELVAEQLDLADIAKHTTWFKQLGTYHEF